MEEVKKNSRQFTVARQFTIHKNEISTMSLELRATPEPLAADLASDSDSDMSSCSDLMDDDLQATYDDPPHLSIPPNTWAEMEKRILLQNMEEDILKRNTGDQMIDPMEKRLQQLEDTVIKVFAVLQSTGAAVEEVAGAVKVLSNDLGELTENVNSNTRHIAVATNNINTLQADQRHQKQIEAHTDQSRATPVAGVKRNTGAPSADTCETGIFVSGVQELKRHFKMDPLTDPLKVAEKLMGKIGCYHTINKINLADNAVNPSTRHKTRAVIIYLNSVYHKRQAAVRLKNFLDTEKLRATVSDVFPAQETERANALNRFALKQRQEKPQTRTRVVNINGTAILQHAEGKGQPYKNYKISQEALEPYYKRFKHNNRGKNNNKRESGNKRSRQEKELRDQERANTRIGNAQHPNQQHHQRQQQQSPLQAHPQREVNKPCATIYTKQQQQPAACTPQNTTTRMYQKQQQQQMTPPLQHPHPLQHQQQQQKQHVAPPLQHPHHLQHQQQQQQQHVGPPLQHPYPHQHQQQQQQQHVAHPLQHPHPHQHQQHQQQQNVTPPPQHSHPLQHQQQEQHLHGDQDQQNNNNVMTTHWPQGQNGHPVNTSGYTVNPTWHNYGGHIIPEHMVPFLRYQMYCQQQHRQQYQQQYAAVNINGQQTT